MKRGSLVLESDWIKFCGGFKVPWIGYGSEWNYGS